MATIEGTQNIPSALKTFYDGTLTPLMPNAVIRSRYPWRIPRMQTNGSGVSLKQKEQRTRWITVLSKFKLLPLAVRQRWYAAAPQYHSLLFYFNYFMLSGLMGNAVIGETGGGVIKSIQHLTFSLPSGTPAPVTVSCSAIDPTKSICFFFGGGGAEVLAGVAIPVYPYLASLLSTYAIVKASMDLIGAAGGSVSIIEYL